MRSQVLSFFFLPCAALLHFTVHQHSWRGHAQSRYSFSSGLSTALKPPQGASPDAHDGARKEEKRKIAIG